MGTMKSRRMMSTNKMIDQNGQNGSYKPWQQKRRTYSVALVSRKATAKIRTESKLKSSRRPEWTYISVPLEMLVDEPEGGDIGYEGEETGNNPPDIMR